MARPRAPPRAATPTKKEEPSLKAKKKPSPAATALKKKTKTAAVTVKAVVVANKTSEVQEKAPKRARVVKEKDEDETATTAVMEDSADVYITSSKACNAFKTRASELEALVKAAHPGAKVFINTEKKISSNPDKGTFAVKVKGKTLVELVAMPRPFSAMKALVIKDLADKVIKAL